MPYFVINGKPDCPNFIHAAFVAQYLSERLPDFLYKKIELLPRDWALYLDDINRENTWYLTESPVIWKELNMWGGKKYLLGGLSEFWEHVYCYYGLESLLPKCSLLELAGDNLKFFLNRQKCRKNKEYQYITVLGASNPVTCFVVNDILKIKSLRKTDGIVFKFYDHLQAIDKQKYQQLVDSLIHFNDSKIFGNNNLVEICETKDEAIANSDIIIHLEDFTRRDDEGYRNWLERCNYRMKILADSLLACGKRIAKIIIANHGPVCFLATCLWMACLHKFPNIVAVTSDQGLPYITSVSEKTGILVEKISAPAVWGCIGLNCFVDVKNILFKADMYRPFKSSLTSPKGSTLPLGVVNSELRLMSYMINDVTVINRDVAEKNDQILQLLGRPPIFSKARALVSLLELWYGEEVGDEIISLGIPSDGTFRIPPGVVFSQPVKLDECRRWMSYGNYPLMDNDSRARVKECVRNTKKILVDYGILNETDLSIYAGDYDDYRRYLDGIREMGEDEGSFKFDSNPNILFDE